MSALLTSFDNLSTTLNLRNRWITKYQEDESHLSDNEKMHIYFGLADRQGNINNEYNSYMEIIDNSVNDIIFHSHSLYVKLMKRLIQIKSSRAEKEIKKLQYQIVDFQGSWDSGLFPSKADYSTWFVPTGKVKKKWYWSRKRTAQVLIKFTELYGSETIPIYRQQRH